MSAIVISPGEGKSISLGPGGIGVVFKLNGADTGGLFSLVEHPIPPGSLAPPHLHHDEDEYSYVLEGDVTVLVGDQLFHAIPGTLISKPRGIYHAFWNEGPAPARVLEIISPAGFEKFFEEISELSSVEGPAGLQLRLQLAHKYHQEYDLDRIPELVQKYHLNFPTGKESNRG